MDVAPKRSSSGMAQCVPARTATPWRSITVATSCACAPFISNETIGPLSFAAPSMRRNTMNRRKAADYRANQPVVRNRGVVDDVLAVQRRVHPVDKWGKRLWSACTQTGYTGLTHKLCKTVHSAIHDFFRSDLAGKRLRRQGIVDLSTELTGSLLLQSLYIRKPTGGRHEAPSQVMRREKRRYREDR